MASITRTKRLHVMLSSKEWKDLHALADKAGLSVSDWTRLKIRDAAKRELARRKR